MAGQGKARAVGEMAVVVGTVACVKDGGNELGGYFQEEILASCSSPLRLDSKALTVGSSHYLSASGNMNQFCGEALGLHRCQPGAGSVSRKGKDWVSHSVLVNSCFCQSVREKSRQ